MNLTYLIKLLAIFGLCAISAAIVVIIIALLVDIAKDLFNSRHH